MALRRMQSADAFRRGVALGALSGCFAALVHSFFDFPLHTTANGLLFLTLAALATTGGRVEQARRRRKRKQGTRETSAPADAAEQTRAEVAGRTGDDIVRAPEGEGAATA
jgi:hypothetical protein